MSEALCAISECLWCGNEEKWLLMHAVLKSSDRKYPRQFWLPLCAMRSCRHRCSGNACYSAGTKLRHLCFLFMVNLIRASKSQTHSKSIIHFLYNKILPSEKKGCLAYSSWMFSHVKWFLFKQDTCSVSVTLYTTYFKQFLRIIFLVGVGISTMQFGFFDVIKDLLGFLLHQQSLTCLLFQSKACNLFCFCFQTPTLLFSWFVANVYTSILNGFCVK